MSHSHELPRKTLPSLPAIAKPGRRRRKVLTVTGLGLAGLLAGLLSGCTGANQVVAAPASTNAYAAASGNWLFTSGSSARPSSWGGALSVSGTSVTGTLHAMATTCATAQTSVAVAGSIDANGVLSITSKEFAGGTLSISGALASDRHSLVSPAMAITGGSCATAALGQGSHATVFARETTAPTAQQFQPLTGSYTGTFTSDSGGKLTVAASLSQPTVPDLDGTYHLTGTASFTGDACVSAPVLTDSVVTGNTITATYTDPETKAAVTGSGTFSADGSIITIAHWALTGCGDDSGSGVLVRQSV